MESRFEPDPALIQHSIETIIRGQDKSGAFIAAFDYPTYAYCWLRDGSFIAYAVLKYGRADAAAAFLSWCSKALLGQASSVESLEARIRSDATVSVEDFLPARYELDGSVSRDDWPNFQIDGYGTWLWLLAEYRKISGRDIGEFVAAAELSVRYLELVWNRPNYDCWEENGDRIHPATLACVYGGLSRVAELPEFHGSPTAAKARVLAERVRNFVESNLLPVGRYPKYLGSNSVDASLVWLALPFGLAEPDSAAMRATVAEIERKTVRDNGTQRYAEDTYYGGGRWIILSAWLAWYYLRTGNRTRAADLISWVEAQADPELSLPEQVAENLNDPAFLPVWEKRWGPSARPLLWSHAMYLVVCEEFNSGKPHPASAG